MKATALGSLPAGESIELYTLENRNGASVQVMTYGATITSLRVPDRAGRVENVVLGFRSLAEYTAPHPYFGAVAGRVAGRLTGGRFTLEGKTYALAVNNPPNHLHGGLTGFNRRIWMARTVLRADGADAVRFTYRSPDGEEGYPGEVKVSVTYALTANNAVVMETEAATDAPTPLNLTQHSYFNLAGEHVGNFSGHLLQVRSSEYVPTDDDMTLLGHRMPVAGTANDFTEPRRLGEVVPRLHRAHGELYFLSHNLSRRLRPAARLYDPESGRVLTVNTTEDYIQFYSGSGLDGSLVGKSGSPYGPHSGLCLECEGYPDGPNTPALGDIILRPGQPLRQTTVYAFSTQ